MSKLEDSIGLRFIQDRSRFGIKPGLERVHEILTGLGHPEQKLSILHVGGTNGKGSTIAFLEAVAIAAGLKVGKYTSPHLVSYTERITINKQPITLECLDALVEELRPAIEKLSDNPEYGQLTEFEVSTILALQYFSLSKVDLALVEVGMGGRLDATNTVHPMAVGLTHIDLDHQEILGPDLTNIAKEKAGIIKPGVPIVSASQYPETMQVLQHAAQTAGAPLVSVGKEVLANVLSINQGGTLVEMSYKDEQPRQVRLSLLGGHQAENAAVAYGLVHVLKEKGFGEITDEAVIKGFETAVWPGRFEYLPVQPRLLFDGGHNPDGFRALAKGLDLIFKDLPKIAVVGILNNRPVEEMAKIISGQFNHVIVTQVNSPNSANPERLADAFTAAGVRVDVVPKPSEAFSRGKELALSQKGLLVVAGSLYLVGQLRALALT